MTANSDSGRSFELGADNAAAYLVQRGLAPPDARLHIEELAGGVSATVVAVRGPGVAVVVKQALARLRVTDEWRAKPERTETEAAAMRLGNRLTPGRVPLVHDSDPATHTMVMELLPPDARNWQAEVAEGRVHAPAGFWAGETLGTWHKHTENDASVAQTFDDFESFEQLRLSPFFETVIERRGDLEDDIAPRLAELRDDRRCFVHGDYAMKNTLVGATRRWVLDFEVAHFGNPVFDLAFFLSFVVLSAVRWPALTDELRTLDAGFSDGYASGLGDELEAGSDTLTAHTGCLVLARTDGKSPAQFLDPPAVARAREVGVTLVRRPERGIWQWL